MNSTGKKSCTNYWRKKYCDSVHGCCHSWYSNSRRPFKQKNLAWIVAVIIKLRLAKSAINANYIKSKITLRLGFLISLGPGALDKIFFLFCKKKSVISCVRHAWFFSYKILLGLTNLRGCRRNVPRAEHIFVERKIREMRILQVEAFQNI